MGTMRTIEDNKLIAEFVGYKKQTNKQAGANLVDNVYEWYLKDVEHYYINGDWIDEVQLRFDTDWNWIMKAVDKIEDITNDDETYRYIIEILGTTVNVIETDRIIPIAETFEKTKIEATYNAVIEFIKYYNNEN